MTIMKFRYIIKVLFAVIISFSIISCNEYDKFEEELYEKNIYIVSTSNFNIFDLECDMSSDNSEYYISISASGTRKIDQNVQVSLRKDTVLLRQYNYSNYDAFETEKFAQELPSDKFNIPSYDLTLKADNDKVYELFPIKIESENLFYLPPDSTYFIPLAIDKVSAYNVNEDKRNVLVRVVPKNPYARSKETTMYGLKGFKGANTDLQVHPSIEKSNKIVQPLTGNSVKMNVGVEDTEVDKMTPTTVARLSMVVTVHEDKSLSIAPYMPEAGLLEVEMLPQPEEYPDFLYVNRYEAVDDPYIPDRVNQRFLMYYRYRTRTTNTANWSAWSYIREASSRLTAE